MTVPPGGDGMEVRPHPHIGLATVTYLFDGGIFHRDSLGYAQAIRPGDVNWMTAGRGIAHSERTEAEMRRTRLHHARRPDLGGAAARATRRRRRPSSMSRRPTLPAWSDGGASLRLIVGTYGGRTRADHALLADLLRRAPRCRRRQDRGLAASTPSAASMSSRARSTIGDRQLGVGDLAVLRPAQPVDVLAGAGGAKLMLLGGAPMDGPRHIWWNFVSSSQGAHRAGQGRLERRPLRQGAGRSGIHPAAGQIG